MSIPSLFAWASADLLVLTKTKHWSGKLSRAIPSVPSISILLNSSPSHSISLAIQIPFFSGTGRKSLSTSVASNQSATCLELETVADNPIICMSGLISLNFDKVTSSVGPLLESLIKCISSETRHPTSVSHAGLCRINESALSEVATIISYFESPLILSKSPTETPILAPLRIFLQMSLNSLTFSHARALKGTKKIPFFPSFTAFIRAL